MKKFSASVSTVSAACAVLASPAVMAQSSVTVYGILDGGYNHVTGLRQGSINHIASGIMEGSRFGLKGSEDIGNGYKAIFTLENRLELDTGSVSNRAASGTQLPDRISTAAGLGLTGAAAAVGPLLIPTINTQLGSAIGVNVGTDGNRLFDRQAFVGLITPVGAVTLGRQYTPGYLVGGMFDASQTQSSLALGQVASVPMAFDIRLSNTVQYTIQTQGVTAALMYGAGEVAASNAASQFWGGMLTYKGAGFSLGYGRNQRKNELAQKSLENNVFGATLDVGPGTLYGEYLTIKDDNPSGLSTIGAAATAATGSAAIGAAYQAAYNNAFTQNADVAHVGYRFTRGVHTWVLAYNRLNDKRASNADTRSYGFTYTYSLSKRTNFNVVLTRFDNRGNGQAAPGGNGFLGGVTAAAGVDATNFALGIRHNF